MKHDPSDGKMEPQDLPDYDPDPPEDEHWEGFCDECGEPTACCACDDIIFGEWPEDDE